MSGPSCPRQERLARAFFFICGAAVLLPWNAYVTAVDYFALVFPGRHIDRVFSVVYMSSNLLSVLTALCTREWVPGRMRIQLGFLGYALVLTAIPVTDAATAAGSLDASTYWKITVIALACAGICDGFCQSALYGDAAIMSTACTQAVVAGTAASGLLVTSLRVLTKAIGGDTAHTQRLSAMLYFGLTITYCAASIAVYTCGICRLPLYKHKRGEHSASQYPRDLELQMADTVPQSFWASDRAKVSSSIELFELHDADAAALLVGARSDDVPPLPQQHAGSDAPTPAKGAPVGGKTEGAPVGGKSDLRSIANLYGMLSPQAAGPKPAPDVKDPPPQHWTRVIRTIRVPSASVCAIYAVTLAIFPGFLSEDVQDARLGSWYPVLLFFDFGLWDFLGRFFSAASNLLLACSAARLGFIPLFAWCAMGSAPTTVVFILTAALGFSNGMLTTTAFAEATIVAGAKDAETAGNVMVLCLMFGLILGAVLGWSWLL